MSHRFLGTRHYFASQRRTLRALLVIAVALPAAMVAAWGWLALRHDMDNAELRAAGMARVVQEHASKIFDTNHQINSRLRDVTAGMSNAEVRQHEQELHVRLADIVGGVSQASSVSVFDNQGRLLASSRFFPVPPISIAQREDFRAIVAEGRPFYVTAPHTGQVVPERIVNASMPRLGPGGEMVGVVSVTLRPSYFADFYRDVLSQDPGAEAALVRADGAVLASYPGTAPEYVRGPLQQLLERASEGVRDSVSRVPGLSGADSIVADRAAGSGMLHAVVGIPVSVIQQQWRRRLYMAAMVAAIPSAALWAALGMSLRRLRREEQAFLRWQEEIGKREEAEERYRQSRKLEAVGHLITSVAHDFRNVLSVISFNTDLMITRPDVGREKALAGIKRSLASGVALTNQLIGMARKRQHRKEVLTIGQEAEAWTPLICTTLGSRARLRYDIAPDCWPVCADRNELELAMINLASNARDAMPDGGSFMVSASNVSLDGERPPGMRGDYVCLSARDEGRGMPPEVVERVFEPLFTTKTGGLGSGLGLAQVHDFCREVDGLAVIESEPGKGTVVRLYLPAWKHGDAGMRASGQSSSVLIVADQPRNVHSAVESLQAAGHRVTLVRDEAEALAATDRYGFDLVVCDARLGATLGGLPLRERLVHSYPFLPVVLMTDDADMIALAAVSGLPFLLKPWNAQTLVRAGILHVKRTSDGKSNVYRA
ncbi:signal transduction histidine kinase [Cupriavidus gilardii J11]|uniref:histidine kinase n=1 Tax=Cupriavidus gilardii J11 TaxID=936133 RepID=A0A562BT42_9BURK|nr:ATP-binding protein [Cupriavidus gilardii]TWG88448.1 signal transduction histidine kinase [Cupriavidus gilardii J11]